MIFRLNVDIILRFSYSIFIPFPVLSVDTK